MRFALLTTLALLALVALSVLVGWSYGSHPTYWHPPMSGGGAVDTVYVEVEPIEYGGYRYLGRQGPAIHLESVLDSIIGEGDVIDSAYFYMYRITSDSTSKKGGE